MITVSTRKFVNFTNFREGSFEVRVASTQDEVDSALRLRHRVFNVELGTAESDEGVEFDAFELKCRHLIIVDNPTGQTVGTYRLNTIETAGSLYGFYGAQEFKLEELPVEVISDGIEIGRACIAPEFRNSRVLFLLWKGLFRFLRASGKRFFFGCCSIFTGDETIGANVYHQLLDAGHVSRKIFIQPTGNRIDLSLAKNSGAVAPIPNLFELYLKLGAEICSPPIIDRDFGTIDFFVVLDTTKINERYRRMFS